MVIKQNIQNVITLAVNNQTALKGFFQLSFLRVIQIALGLITTFVLVRSLSVEQYGEYQFVLNIIGVLAVFTLTEFDNTLMQSVARGFTGSFRKMLPYPLMGSLAASAILVVFALWYGMQEAHPDLMYCFMIAALLFPLMQGLTLWRSFKIGEEKFLHFTALETINLICTQGGIILMALFLGGQYVGPFLCFILVPSLINIVMFVLTLRRVPKNKPAEEGVISHGLKSSFFTSFLIVSNSIDKILLFYFLSPAALAIFVASERVSDLLKTAVQDMASALAPKFAKTKNYTERLDKFFKILCLVFGASLVIFAFTFLPYLLVLIYGEKYISSIPYAQALMCAAALGNLASIQFRFIRSKLDTKNFCNIVVGTSLFRIVVSLVLIPLFGIEGAVASAFIYRITMSLSINRVIKNDYLPKLS